jgi:hypothetical protein
VIRAGQQALIDRIVHASNASSVDREPPDVLTGHEMTKDAA